MMQNLVEHLRKSATEPCDGCCYGESMTKAADEIERLVKERDLALANADAVYAKLMAENERLRAEVSHLNAAYDNCNQRVCQLLTEKLGHQQ